MVWDWKSVNDKEMCHGVASQQSLLHSIHLIKKLVGKHDKETYTRKCGHIDICVYAKYMHIIRVCVVQIYLSCTVHVPFYNGNLSKNDYFPLSIKWPFGLTCSFVNHS